MILFKPRLKVVTVQRLRVMNFKFFKQDAKNRTQPASLSVYTNLMMQSTASQIHRLQTYENDEDLLYWH